MTDRNNDGWVKGREFDKTQFTSEVHAIIRNSEAFPGEGEYRVTEIKPDGTQVVILSRSLKGMKA